MERDPIAATNKVTPWGTRAPLRISATVELISLVVLLVNLATANSQGVAALVGPVHGIAWLFGIITTWRDPRRTAGIAALAVIPGVGGALALRALNRADRYEDADDDTAP